MLEVFFSLLVIVILIVVVSRLARGSGAGAGGVLRSFFRYGFLLALMILVGTGITGLVTLADPNLVAGPGYTALMLACVIVGGPGLLLVTRRVRRALDRSGWIDQGWDVYLIVAETISLVTAAVGGYIWGESLTRGDFRLTPAAVAFVWGGIWYTHHHLAGRRDRAGLLRYGVLLGSLIGLATGAGFGVALLQALIGRVYVSVAGSVVTELGHDGVWSSLVGLVIWAAVWLRYWWFLARQQERTPVWRGYVLLFGVVGTLLTMLTGAWSLVHPVLEWFVDDPDVPAWLHFDDTPLAIGLIVIGGLLWRYHRAVLEAATPTSRSEVDRLPEYTVAGVGLVATVGGLAAVIASSIDTLLPGDHRIIHLSGRPGTEPAAYSGRSGLMAAVTVLLIAAPLWWRYWKSAQSWRRADPDSELLSPTRRTYLVCVFGGGGVLALGSLFFLTYRFLEGILASSLGSGTLFNIRWPLALAITVGVAAAYHRAIRRADLADMPAEVSRLAVRSVVLVGSDSGAVAEAVEERTGIAVQVWDRQDVKVSLSAETIVDTIESSEQEHLLIIARPEGHEVIPYRTAQENSAAR